MSQRRTFLAYSVGMLAALLPARAQQAIMQKGQAVICPGQTLRCPNGHETCATINANLVVGNDSQDYPSVAQLYGKKVIECDQCGVLFVKRY